MTSDYYGSIAGEIADDDDDEYCEHDCGESGCFDDGFKFCHHKHCSPAELDDSRDTPSRTPLGEQSW